MILTGLLSVLLAGPALGQNRPQDATGNSTGKSTGNSTVDDPNDDAPTEAIFEVRDLDVVVRVPIGPEGPGWTPPSWALSSTSSLALEKKGTQLIAMVEEVDSQFQPHFRPDTAQAIGPALTQAFLANIYAGPELGAVTWDPFTLIEGGPLGDHLRATAAIELPDLEPVDDVEVSGRLVIDLYPVRAGVDTTVIVGVATAQEALAAADELASYTAFFDGPVKAADLPTGHHAEDAGYELDLPDGFRALTERERLALNGEPVGGNSGFGGALAFQTYLDPTTIGGWRSFGCVAFSADTLQVVEPDKAPRLANNFRLMSSIMLKGGSYQVDGDKPVRGRAADLLQANTITVDPAVKGTLETVELGDRAAYLWHTKGMKSTAGQSDEPVEVATFYTAWSDVNLHCQAVATPDHAELLSQFDTAVRSLRVTDGAAHPLHLSLMARYKRWWPYTNPLAQLYWLPFPIVIFAAWLASRGD